MWHYDIPATTLGGLADFFKEKLGMDAVQVIGDPNQKAEHLSVLVGGGSLGLGDELMPMRDMMEKGIDTLVCGETTEWTSISYVRDAAQLGLGKGMIILGHNRTEEAGMKHFPAFLQPLVGISRWSLSPPENRFAICKMKFYFSFNPLASVLYIFLLILRRIF